MWRDFVAKYKQTILGPLWFVIQPLLTTLVFVVVFGKMAKIPTDGVPPTLFYLCGLLVWSYFAQTFNGVSATFTNNRQLFAKVYFPRAIVPLSITITGLAPVILNTAILAIFMGLFDFRSSWSVPVSLHWLLFPLIILQTAAIGLGCGLWMAVLTTKYRDFSHISGFLTQLLLYTTPVIYPLSQVDHPWRLLSMANPMTFPLESLKQVLLGQGSPSLPLAACSITITVIVLVTGQMTFQRAQRNVVDTV